MLPTTPRRLLGAVRIAIKSRLTVSLFGVLVRAQCDPGVSFASEQFKSDTVLRKFLVPVALRRGTLKPMTDHMKSRLQISDPLRNFREIPVGMPFEIPQF